MNIPFWTCECGKLQVVAYEIKDDHIPNVTKKIVKPKKRKSKDHLISQDESKLFVSTIKFTK